MKPKTLILMAVAISCGLGASYMASRLLAERSQESEDKVPVLVLKRNMNQGEPLKNIEDIFEEKDFIRGQEPKEAIIEPDQLRGKVLKRSLRAGDFIRSEDILGGGEYTMANLMPLGYRALGIRVNAESIAGGFASLPHSRVDIVNTVRRSDEKTSYAQLLLEDVLVLAADAQISRNENSPAMLANVVTVALKPEDAMKVALAREIGTLSLVLRRFNDKGRSEETKITVEGLITKTAGSGNAEIASDNPAAPSAAKVPNVPAIPKVQAKPAVEATQVAKNEPKGKIFRMRILEGNKERFVGFPQDENGNFVQPEVNRTDLTPARPEAKKNDIN